MKSRGLLAAAVFLPLLAFPGSLFAITKIPGSVLQRAGNGSEFLLGAPVILNADTLSYDEDTGVALAEGNVEIGFGNRTFRADRIRYDSGSGEAELTGKVHYKDAGDEFSFDRIVLNIQNERGVLYNGSIRLSTNNYLISSEVFEKTGDRTFRIKKGALTTCPCDPEPDWKFEVRRASVTIDGYAVGRNVTFKVRGVPVLWLPWAAFPVKLTRQSGILIPSFTSSGSKGFSVQLPFYWAISRWSDATVTLEEMSRRGLRPELEYRYVLNRESEGEAKATAYHDKKTGEDRSRFYGKNTYRDGERLTINAKWDHASDAQYYVDLVEEDVLRTARHVASRGFAGTDGSGIPYAISVVWVNEIQNTSNDNTVQRLPEYTATFLPYAIGKTGFETSGDINATYFHKRLGNRELRGRGYAEIFRTFSLYHSFTMTPFLSLDMVGSYPVSAEEETRKSGRVLPGGGFRMEADFRRDFDQGEGMRLIHLLKPDVSFRWVPTLDQKDIPLTDQWARVASQTQFTFSINQRLLRIVKDGGPLELASLSVEWALDIGGKKTSSDSPYLDPLSPYVRTLRDQIDLAGGRLDREPKAASDLFARFRVRAAERWSFTGETLYGIGTRDLTAAGIGAEWKRDKENQALIEYRTSRALSEDILGFLAFRPIHLLGLRSNVNYSLKKSELTEGSVTFTIYPRSDCWSVGFESGRRTFPRENIYKLLFSLKGIGTVGN